jgi:para-aminobenzoate synthetase/4-amino-4-deoxychorismate lyase
MQRWRPLPTAVYSLVERTPGAVLLESASVGNDGARSRLFLSPSRILTATDAASLDSLFEHVESSVQRGHFAAGYFSYECGSCFEPKAGLRPAGPGQPLAWFGIYPQCHVFDHAAGRFVDAGPAEIANELSAGESSPAQAVEVHLGIDEAQYAERIATIHELIRAGDIYQLNFTFPLRLKVQGRAADLYATLRGRQPVAYGAFLHCDSGRRILSFSPELFFRIDRRQATRRIVTRPMKGTAPRGRTTAEDQAVAEWLRHDAKNCSENVMIVDLLRNDLGRLCEYGSVHVDELFAVERYPSLWQMTSTVSGDLRTGVSYSEIFKALFPSGSVTGAPKVRAMQLLAKLEQGPRGVYTGAIGFFSGEQTVFNVAIRTLELNGAEGRMGVGSGIVIDSVAADEFRECALKARFLTGSSEPFLLIETMLWDGAYPLLELHLDRLEDSADYFGFVCDRAEVRASLLSTAEAFGDFSSRRVRLTLDADGNVSIEHEPILVGSARSSPLRVRVVMHRTDPADRFLFHKTTNRAVYAEAFNAARAAGFEDALFLNSEGQVTEAAASNIFIEREGQWATPPIACGVLAGVYRRHLLATRPNIEERILRPEDLKAADGVYLSNAVRGLRRVVIDWENAAAPAAAGVRTSE